jgi:hypothetical protein
MSEMGGLRAFAMLQAVEHLGGMLMFGLLATTTMIYASPCALPFKVVRTEAAALSIAKVVVEAAPDGPGAEAPYYLKAEYFEKEDRWVVFESKPGMLGGDGLAMLISGCDGAVSSVRRQR